MRSLKFDGIKTRFIEAKGSGVMQRKAMRAYYIVPAFIFTGMAFSKFVSDSFGIYLKY